MAVRRPPTRSRSTARRSRRTPRTPTPTPTGGIGWRGGAARSTTPPRTSTRRWRRGAPDRMSATGSWRRSSSQAPAAVRRPTSRRSPTWCGTRSRWSPPCAMRSSGSTRARATTAGGSTGSSRRYRRWRRLRSSGPCSSTWTSIPRASRCATPAWRGCRRRAPPLREPRRLCYVNWRSHYVHLRNGPGGRKTAPDILMPNPFVYGEVVPGEAFVDREVELDRLIGDLAAGQKVFLISPRRYGKSSLVRQALDGLARRGTLTVEVTVSSYSSYMAFLEGYARALASLETKWDRARSWLTGAIQSTRPELRYEPKDSGLGRVSVAFPLVRSDRDINRLANEIYALPGQVAAARKRQVVVALDEFQAIEGFNGGSVEHGLRAAAQHQRQVGYVFAGSEPSLMEKMIGPRRPFYKAGPVMRLQKIPADAFAEFIEARFLKSGIRAEPGLGIAIVDLAGNLPYDVQRLAHETWDDVRTAGGRRATLDQLHTTLSRLLLEQDTMFEAIWQRLTLAQRAVLRASVLQGGRELLSADNRARYRLGGPSSIQASLAALAKQDLLLKEGSRYVVVDSLLREWVARKTF